MCDKRPMFVLYVYTSCAPVIAHHNIYNNNIWLMHNNNNRLYDCDGVETVYVLCIILL